MRETRSNRKLLVEVANGFRPPIAWTPEEITSEESERVVTTALAALYASQMPRRLSEGAPRRALALDKRVSRKVAQAYLDLWSRMNRGREAPRCPSWDDGLKLAALNDDARVMGAQIVWKRWLKDRARFVEKRKSKLAAFALREGLVSWGARRIQMLETEERGIDRAAKALGIDLYADEEEETDDRREETGVDEPDVD